MAEAMRISFNFFSNSFHISTLFIEFALVKVFHEHDHFLMSPPMSCLILFQHCQNVTQRKQKKGLSRDIKINRKGAKYTYHMY